MKRAKKVLGGIAALALAMFLAPGIAQAADYTGNCAGVPSSVTGNVSITDTTCTLPNSVTATGSISITATSISGSGKNLSSGTEIDIETTGATNVGNLTASNNYIRVRADSVTAGDVKTTTYGAVIVVAQGDLQLGEVEAATSYNVNIKAHAGGGNSDLEIGSSGSNKIAKITVKGSGNDQTYASSVVYVTNGDASSSGNLFVSDTSKISVASGSGKPGHIFLNAQSGTLTLPSTSGATLASNGDATRHAGVIALLANTVSFGPAAVVSATESTSTGGLHGVAIAAQTVNHNGLTLQGDGNGLNPYYTGYVQLVPKGAITISESTYPTSMWISGDTIDYTKTGNITYAGSSGSSAFTASAQGNNTRVYVYATKSTFSGGAATFDVRGENTHTINFTTTGTGSGTDGVVFSGAGAVSLNASATAGGTGGNISFSVDKVVMDAPSISINANGPSSGNGNGGEIYAYTANGFALNAASTATFTANAASNGTGDAVFSDASSYSPKAITLYAGWSNIVNVGTSSGQFSFSANGGFSGGNAGAVNIASANVRLKTAGAMNFNALGGDGNGGAVRFLGYIDEVSAGTANPSVSAKGHGTGKGGQFMAYHAAGELNVNAIFKVDPEISGISTSVSAGQITLNNKTCEQWKTGFASGAYPTTYWNCIDSSRSTGMSVATAANSLESALRTHLSNRPAPNETVQIYVMPISSDFGSYFGGYTFAQNLYGLGRNSVRVAAAFSTIYDSSWNQQSASSVSGSATIMDGTIVHELGHHLDYIWGDLSVNDGTFLSNRTSDLTRLLNSTPCTAAFTSATCANYTGNNPATGNPWTNLEIYQNRGFSTSNIELFPIVFEQLESKRTGSYSVHPDLEKASDTQFTDMQGYIQGKINSPPTPVN